MKAETRATPVVREVRELRHSSRLLVRVLGVMQNGLEGVACTPAQCHVLMELADRGRLTTGELAELLQIDKSTASRTLRPLLDQGLLTAQVDPGDQRSKPLELSAAGHERVGQIHLAADAQVQGALDLLTEEERGIVLRGVSLYERALHRSKALAGVVVRPVEVRDEPGLAALLRSVLTEFGAVGSGYAIVDPELTEMHRAYSGERSVYFVAEREGELLAGAGIAPLEGHGSGEVCELRKLHALPAARGLGIGRQLLERCLSAAREEGFEVCYLETLKHLHRARALYKKLGFKSLERPMGDTGHFACDDWYALEL